MTEKRYTDCNIRLNVTQAELVTSKQQHTACHTRLNTTQVDLITANQRLTAMTKQHTADVATIASLQSERPGRHSMQHSALRVTHMAVQLHAYLEDAAVACDLPMDGRQPGHDMLAAVSRLAATGHGRRVLTRLGLDATTMSGMTATQLLLLAGEHIEAIRQDRLPIRERGGGPAAVGNWTREHPALQRDASGRIDPASIGDPSVTQALDGGRYLVVGPVLEARDAAGDGDGVLALRAGRVMPMHEHTDRDDALPDAGTADGGIHAVSR